MLQFLISLFLILLTFSSDASAVEFCVADLDSPHTITGYPCKDIKKVTVDDFVYSGLNERGIDFNSNANITFGFVSQFPGLNGLGIGLAHANIGPGGFVPIHAHPDSSEVIYVISGSITGGFISSDNIPFVKSLRKGEVMIFPRGLMHFLVNNDDDEPAEAVFSFGNHDVKTQLISHALLGNDFSSDLLRKTFVDHNAVDELKVLIQKNRNQNGEVVRDEL